MPLSKTVLIDPKRPVMVEIMGVNVGFPALTYGERELLQDEIRGMFNRDVGSEESAGKALDDVMFFVGSKLLAIEGATNESNPWGMPIATLFQYQSAEFQKAVIKRLTQGFLTDAEVKNSLSSSDTRISAPTPTPTDEPTIIAEKPAEGAGDIAFGAVLKSQ